MADKKYYWLKLKSDFFDDDTIKYIEEQENGIKYSNFYLKLCLKSLKNDGKLIRLVGETFIPYDVNSLSKLTMVDIDIVRCAMLLFEKIGLIKILETGEIYLSQINEMIGSETDKAQIMRRIRAEKNVNGNNVTKMLPKCYTEIEKEKEIDIEINNNKYNYEEFQKQYNEICTNLPKIQKLTTKRKTNIRKFLSEFTLEDFITICKKANESDFMQGKNERNWKADFDFLIKVDKATNILEGKYDNTKKQNENHINYNNLDNLYANFKN